MHSARQLHYGKRTTVSYKCDQAFDLQQLLELASELESNHCDTGKRYD